MNGELKPVGQRVSRIMIAAPARAVRFAALLLGIALAACASAGNRADAVADEAPARVHIRNEAFWDANVYLVQGGSRRRLGMVNGNSTQTFELPRHLTMGLADVRFVIDWIGRRDGAASETIAARPGDEIHLIIR